MIEARVDVDARIFDQKRCAGQAQPHAAQNPFTHFRLACNPFPKIEEPWRAHTGLEKRGRGGMIVH